MFFFLWFIFFSPPKKAVEGGYNIHNTLPSEQWINMIISHTWWISGDTDYIYLLGRKTVRSNYLIRLGSVGACEILKIKYHYNQMIMITQPSIRCTSQVLNMQDNEDTTEEIHKIVLYCIYHKCITPLADLESWWYGSCTPPLFLIRKLWNEPIRERKNLSVYTFKLE